MPKNTSRANLQEGLALNLNQLIRERLVRPGDQTGLSSIRWVYAHCDYVFASGTVAAQFKADTGALRIRVGDLDQSIRLIGCPRHFGGYQWYFQCPQSGRPCSVLWMPPGTRSFASRQAWGNSVAYGVQFLGRRERLIAAAMRLRTGLGGGKWASLLSGDPPKPKWMRWPTYLRLVQRARRAQAVALSGLACSVGQEDQPETEDAAA